MSREPDAGVVLVNVLIVLALSASVVYAMLTLADLSIARSRSFSEAGQALALVRGGEQSAIAALRRDMIEAPDLDYAAEPWSKVAQEPTSIAGGTFELRIADAQGRFNLNTLAASGLQGLDTVRGLGAAADLHPEDVARILASLAIDGPLERLDDLVARAGIDPASLARLGTLATALPGTGDVNINAAPEALLAVMLKNPGLARRLVDRRARAGVLTRQDVETAGALLPPGLGYRSNLFRLVTTVRIGDTVQSIESLLRRREGPDGPEVVVIARQAATAAAVPPPPLR